MEAPSIPSASAVSSSIRTATPTAASRRQGGSRPGAFRSPARPPSLLPFLAVLFSLLAGAMTVTPGWAQSSLAAPTHLTATPLSGSLILLSWSESSRDQTGFGVWRKDNAGNWTLIGVAPGNSRTYLDWNLTSNTSYDYRIRAHNSLVASGWSDEARVTTLDAPAAPTGLLALTVTSTEIGLFWSDQSNNETGFSIWRKSTGNDWVRIGVAPASTEFFTDRGLTPDTAYQYRVRAYNSQSASRWSNEASAVTETAASVQLSAPPVAASPTTRVSVAFSLPAGYALGGGTPRVSLMDAAGRLASLQPVLITQRQPQGAGYKELATVNYPPGHYQLRAELLYRRPDGSLGGIASPWTGFVVPPAALSGLFVTGGGFSTIFVPGTQLAEAHLTRLPFGQDGVVALSSSNPALVQVPASVTVPSWTSAVSFQMVTAPVTTTTSVTVTARYQGTTALLPLVLAATRRVAVYRPSTGEWLIRAVDGSRIQVEFGAPGDQPVPADYLGTGKAQIAVFRPGTGEWLIRNDGGGTTSIPWGSAGDDPVPGDYLGLGHAQVAIYRPGTQEWLIRNPDGTPARVVFGAPGDQPVPADYLGLRRVQIAVFRPSTQEWWVRRPDGSAQPVTWGAAGEQPAPADFLALGHVQPAAYNPDNDQWSIRRDDGTALLLPSLALGGEPRPIPSDYFGMGHDQAAMFRDGQWIIRYGFGDQPFFTLMWGAAGDIPVPANYWLPS